FQLHRLPVCGSVHAPACTQRAYACTVTAVAPNRKALTDTLFSPWYWNVPAGIDTNESPLFDSPAPPPVSPALVRLSASFTGIALPGATSNSAPASSYPSALQVTRALPGATSSRATPSGAARTLPPPARQFAATLTLIKSFPGNASSARSTGVVPPLS